MRPFVQDFLTRALTAADVAGKAVVETGALDVNGSARPAAEALGPASYLATDIRPGPGVDQICDAAGLDILGPADVVISAEMLEHAADWRSALAGMVRALAPGGLLILTTVESGFPYHAYPDDYWRFPVSVLSGLVRAAGLDTELVETDVEHGVCLTARKPPGWTWPAVAGGQWAGLAPLVMPVRTSPATPPVRERYKRMSKQVVLEVTQPFHGTGGVVLYQPGERFPLDADLPEGLTVKEVIADVPDATVKAEEPAPRRGPGRPRKTPAEPAAADDE